MSSSGIETFATLYRAYVRGGPGWVGKGVLTTGCLNAHLRDHPRRRVVSTRFGARFAVDTRDLIQRYIYLFGVWEPHMTHWLRRRLRPGDTFVDVGANIGYYSVLASQLVGLGGRVVAIEASEQFHQRLLQNVRLNGCANVRAMNIAVSGSREVLRFVLASSKNMGANSIVPYDGPAESTFEIEALPLAEVLSAEEIETARVIKIDVEGAEGGVVRGLAPVLGRLRADAEVTVEVAPDRMRQLGESLEELLDTMQAHGFHTYRLTNEYAPESYPAALRRPPAVPVRWRQPVTGESDLIFSRVDAETLP
ncbi:MULTISPECIES: FkbM family methyltransferase [Streptomyces]|uniref:FkbM family methyltransferase n=2 Tax=Streptomyces TaxID=1883 RepID=A0A420V1R2_9ACTN|nr:MULTISPECIES: FkbM family methyltransferase [Streptomyces]KNE79642.1 FkbM family methyltransferase [Streptomyces fradiae]OFA37743.1 FkbM family methyltransferase [Streptomyces fradiae]PQM23212.1 FkbM family methyltransferase [Streptomyces xinghaiensis]RKM94773.1 FkbM family methyltransferase [Streptomyces xinghaiensis]RNC74786.1 FkbM family methyltransferase [Streptomyces xinghaiensis]